MKKLLLVAFLLTGCAPKEPPKLLSDEIRLQIAEEELRLSLHFTNTSEKQAEVMRAYVECLERVRKAYGK